MSSADEAGAGAAGQVGTEGGAGYGLEAGIVGDVTGSGEPGRASGMSGSGAAVDADSDADAAAGASAGTVVVVGSINVDQVVTVARLPRPGETLIGTGMVLLPGGKGANQAVAAARRGASTVMVGAVGDDVHAAAATPLLTESGVDVSRVEVVSGPTGLAVVSVGDDAENTIVVVPGANASVGRDAVERHADVLRTASVVVLQGEIPADGIEHAARLASGRVLLNLAPVVAVDPDVVRLADPLVLNEHEGRLVLALLEAAGTPAGAVPVGLAVSPEGEVVAGVDDSSRNESSSVAGAGSSGTAGLSAGVDDSSRDESSSAAGAASSGTAGLSAGVDDSSRNESSSAAGAASSGTAGLPAGADESPRDESARATDPTDHTLGEARDADAAVVTALRQHGVPSVVLTRGSAGAIVSDSSGLHHVASPRVAAVDSSGAGDAFVGALAARLAAGATLLDAAHEAVRVGAYSVTGSGTQPSYPRLGDELPSVESDAEGDATAPGDGGSASSGASLAAGGRA